MPAKPIVQLDRFIEATRDSGYRGTASAVAELVDNSIEAWATEVNIEISRTTEEHPIKIIVADNGCGMTATTLETALQFGGSTRFGSRESLGRYGMGLPNASLSQCRRFEVLSWRTRKSFLYSYLDVDEIASGSCVEIPEPRRRRPWSDVSSWCDSNSGTVVVWSRADRLDNKRPSTIVRKLRIHLGRVFRHYIWEGITLKINGVRVTPIDPLFIAEDSITRGGVLHHEWSCEIASSEDPRDIGIVHVRFARLPIKKWHDLSNAEKRAKGITNGAGVSVVRAGREIDYGWHFLRGKARQNYDDWWRCEVKFEPILDSAFGITHTKQDIRPEEYLIQALATHIVVIAQDLSVLVRKDYQALRLAQEPEAATYLMINHSGNALPPLTTEGTIPSPKLYPEILDALEELGLLNGQSNNHESHHVLLSHGVKDGMFLEPFRHGADLIACIDPKHPLHKTLFPTHSLTVSRVQNTLIKVLAAAARAEATTDDPDERKAIKSFRERWRDYLASLLDPSTEPSESRGDG